MLEHHHLCGIHVFQKTLDARFQIELEDEETGEQMLVDTSDDSFREEYCKITKKHETDLAKKLGKIGVGFAKVLSNEPYEIPLRKLFRYRMV